MIEQVSEELQQQATETVISYLKEYSKQRWAESGVTYVKAAKSEVMAGFIIASAIEVQTRTLAAILQESVKALCDAIRDVPLPQEVDRG